LSSCAINNINSSILVQWFGWVVYCEMSCELKWWGLGFNPCSVHLILFVNLCKKSIKSISLAIVLGLGLSSDWTWTQLGLTSDSPRIIGVQSESDRTHRTLIRFRSDWWGSVKYWAQDAMPQVFYKCIYAVKIVLYIYLSCSFRARTLLDKFN